MWEKWSRLSSASGVNCGASSSMRVVSASQLSSTGSTRVVRTKPMGVRVMFIVASRPSRRALRLAPLSADWRCVATLHPFVGAAAVLAVVDEVDIRAELQRGDEAEALRPLDEADLDLALERAGEGPDLDLGVADQISVQEHVARQASAQSLRALRQLGNALHHAIWPRRIDSMAGAAERGRAVGGEITDQAELR